MNGKDNEENGIEFERLLQTSLRGSHRSANHAVQQAEVEDHALRNVSRIIDSLPVLGILSEIGFQEGRKQLEFQEEKQEVAVTKILDDINDHLDSQDEILADICPSHFNAEFLVDAIIKASRSGQNCQSAELQGLIKVTQSLINCSHVEKHLLSKHLLSNINSMSLSVVIQLTESGLITAQHYITELHKQNRLLSLKNELLEHFRLVEPSKKWDNETEKIFKFIMSISATSDSNEVTIELKNAINSLVYSVFEHTDFSALFGQQKCHREWSLVMKLAKVNTSNCSQKTSLATLLLENLMLSGDRCSLDQAFLKHFAWSYQELGNQTTDVLQELLVYPDEDTIAKVIKIAIRKQALNLQRFLAVISVWLILSEESQRYICDLLRTLCVDAFELQSKEILKICLLIARHCSLERLSGFPDYSDWFADHSTHVSSIISNDKKLLQFYVNCLSSLLPFETKFFLSIQISNIAKVQSSGKNIAQEYITVARTRINDLKDINLEKSRFPSIQNKINELAIKDVDKVLSQFAANSKIPTNLLEVSVFRKAYFVGSFLPALLIPSLVQNDINRQKLVEELCKAGKIPSKVLQTFQEDVEAYALENEFSNADVTVSKLVDIVFRKISELLEVLEERKKKDEPKRKRSLLQSYMSSLSAHLNKLYEAFDTRSCQPNERIEFQGKLTDAILNSICHACALECKEEATTSDYKWVKTLVQVLKEYKDLQSSFKIRISEFLSNQLHKVESYHLHGIACVVAAYDLGYGKDTADRTSIMEMAAESIISAQTFLWMPCGLQFISNVFLFCTQMYSDVIIARENVISQTSTLNDTVVISSRVITDWMILFTRAKAILEILPAETTHEDFLRNTRDALQLAESVININVFKCYTSNNTVTADQWLNFELSIEPQHDVISSCQKQEYYYCIINTHQASSDSIDWKYRNLARKIVNSLLNFERKHDSLKCNEHCYGTNRHMYARGSSFNDMLCLLQSLNHKITFDLGKCDDSVDNNSSWLRSALLQWIAMIKNPSNCTKEDNDYIAKSITEHQLPWLCCILRALPPSALFSSDMLVRITRECLNEVSSFVNTIASLSLQNSFVLPYAFTGCLLDAIISYCMTSMKLRECSISEANANLAYLFKLCPILCISLVHHSAKSPIREKIEHSVSNGFRCFKPFTDLHVCLSNNITMINSVEKIAISRKVIGVCIFNAMEHSLDEQYKWTTILQALSDEVLQIVFECLMIQLSMCLIEGTIADNRGAQFISLLLIIFKKNSDIVVNITDDVLAQQNSLGLQELRLIFCNQSTFRIYPVAFLKVLANMDSSDLQNFASFRRRDVMSKCFKHIDGLVRDFESAWPEGLLMQPFSLQFIKEFGVLERRLKIIQ